MKNGKETEEEDVLQEYVVLDIRSIETNQFADGKAIYADIYNNDAF